MARQIKVHDNIYNELSTLKDKGETFSELLARLIELFKLLKKVQREIP